MFKGSYDDTEVREFSKKFLKEVFNFSLIDHPNNKAIDLIMENNYTFGVELERGGWYGDLWKNRYSLISGYEFRTINIPIRKLKYWYNITNDNILPNKLENWFIRTNKNFTQVILIKPDTIKDSNKIIFTEIRPRNSNQIEKFMSFKMEHVETYNLKKNKWTK
jgi:hypothetical protein